MKLGYGNNWIVAAIVVTLPFCTRPVALPVLATLAVSADLATAWDRLQALHPI